MQTHCLFFFPKQIAFGLGYLLNLEKELAFGLLAIGCSPGGGGSNILTHLLDGDINLSIVMTFVSNIFALGIGFLLRKKNTH